MLAYLYLSEEVMFWEVVLAIGSLLIVVLMFIFFIALLHNGEEE